MNKGASNLAADDANDGNIVVSDLINEDTIGESDDRRLRWMEKEAREIPNQQNREQGPPDIDARRRPPTALRLRAHISIIRYQDPRCSSWRAA